KPPASRGTLTASPTESAGKFCDKTDRDFLEAPLPVCGDLSRDRSRWPTKLRAAEGLRRNLRSPGLRSDRCRRSQGGAHFFARASRPARPRLSFRRRLRRLVISPSPADRARPKLFWQQCSPPIRPSEAIHRDRCPVEAKWKTKVLSRPSIPRNCS